MNIEVKNGVYTRNGEEFSFDFYTSLSAYDKLRFVDSVMSTVVTDDGYNYIIKDMIFDYCIVRFFTNVDLSEITDASNNIDAIEEFLYETNIVDIVKANDFTGIIDELEKAVELNIEYKTGIHVNPISISLANLLDTIEQKVENIDFESLMGAANALSGISGELTADKMLDAYAKTDMFKKNWGNVEVEEEAADVVKEKLADRISSPVLSSTV